MVSGGWSTVMRPAEPHHLINVPIYRQVLDDPTVPATVLSLEELETAVALSLLRDSSEVLLALTEYGDPQETPVTQLLHRWWKQTGLDRAAANPILQAAWDRYPFADW